MPGRVFFFFYFYNLDIEQCPCPLPWKYEVFVGCEAWLELRKNMGVLTQDPDLFEKGEDQVVIKM